MNEIILNGNNKFDENKFNKYDKAKLYWSELPLPYSTYQDKEELLRFLSKSVLYLIR